MAALVIILEVLEHVWRLTVVNCLLKLLAMLLADVVLEFDPLIVFGLRLTIQTFN